MEEIIQYFAVCINRFIKAHNKFFKEPDSFAELEKETVCIVDDLGKEFIRVTLEEINRCFRASDWRKEKWHIEKTNKKQLITSLGTMKMEALSLGFHLKNHFNYIGSFSAAPTLSTTCLNIKNWEFAPKVVMVCTGDSDETVGDNPYNYHMALLKNKVEHIWYYYPGGKHSGDVWQNAAVNFAQCCFGNKGNSQS